MDESPGEMYDCEGDGTILDEAKVDGLVDRVCEYVMFDVSIVETLLDGISVTEMLEGQTEDELTEEEGICEVEGDCGSSGVSTTNTVSGVSRLSEPVI